jgi:hypothetical protein
MGANELLETHPKKIINGCLQVFLFSISLVSAALAMTTKEISFTLPITVTLYEFLFFHRKRLSDYTFGAIYLLALFIGPVTLFSFNKPFSEIIQTIGAFNLETQMSRWVYLFTRFRVIATYIRLLILPINQNIDYNYPISTSFFGVFSKSCT